VALWALGGVLFLAVFRLSVLTLWLRKVLFDGIARNTLCQHSVFHQICDIYDFRVFDSSLLFTLLLLFLRLTLCYCFVVIVIFFAFLLLKLQQPTLFVSLLICSRFSVATDLRNRNGVDFQAEVIGVFDIFLSGGCVGCDFFQFVHTAFELPLIIHEALNSLIQYGNLFLHVDSNLLLLLLTLLFDDQQLTLVQLVRVGLLVAELPISLFELFDGFVEFLDCAGIVVFFVVLLNEQLLQE
jgi:hypothetical protein